MVWDGHSRTYSNHERNERQTEMQADEAETRGSTLGDREHSYGSSQFGSDFKNILRLLPTAIPIAFLVIMTKSANTD